MDLEKLSERDFTRDTAIPWIAPLAVYLNNNLRGGCLFMGGINQKGYLLQIW